MWLCVQVHPAKFTRTLVSAAESKGASVRIGTVQGLQTAPDANGHTRVTGQQEQLTLLLGVVQIMTRTWDLFSCSCAGVQVDGDHIHADVVVIAMGPWSGIASQWLPGFPHVEGDKVISNA